MLGGSDEFERITLLCKATEEVLKSQSVIADVGAPAKVFGDVHGQLRDLLLLFYFYGWPCQENSDEWENASYVFNGDWIDRGRHQLEVVVVLLALKIVYPNRIWLNRGNHEDMEQNRKTSREGGLGFDKACNWHFGHQLGPEAFSTFYRTFDWLPIASIIAGRILVLHGGLGDGNWTLDMLRSVERPLLSANLVTALDGVVYNVLWSDPLQADPNCPVETFGVHVSSRAKHSAVMKVFGRDVTERFCIREKLELVIRSHQFKRSGKGYQLMHDGWLMRIFSARNYMGKHENDAGLLLIGRAEGAPNTLLVRPQVVERIRLPQLNDAPPVSEGAAEPYCPQAHLMHLCGPLRPAGGCLPFSRKEANDIECCECKEQGIQNDQFFLCRSCGYNLCCKCAKEDSCSSATHPVKIPGYTMRPITVSPEQKSLDSESSANESTDSDSEIIISSSNLDSETCFIQPERL